MKEFEENVTLSRESIDDLSNKSYDTLTSRLMEIQRNIISDFETRKGEVFNDATYTNLLGINYAIVYHNLYCQTMGVMVGYDARSAIYNVHAINSAYADRTYDFIKERIEYASASKPNIDEEMIDLVVQSFDSVWYKEFKEYLNGDENLFIPGLEGNEPRALDLSSVGAKFLKETINRNVSKDYQLKITKKDIENYKNIVFKGLTEKISISGASNGGCLVPIAISLSSFGLLIWMLIP